jgi:hypothetical protein
MSNTETKKYTPRPYFNVVNYEDPDEQNPNDNSDQSSANSDTQTNREATSEEATYEKRWKDLKKHYDEEVTRLRQEVRELETTKKEAFVPPKTTEELESFRKSNPDLYDAMLSVVHNQVNTHGDEASNRIRQLEEVLASTQQEKAFAEIEKAHPDYVSIANDPNFEQWISMQDDTIQSWVKTNSNNARQFIRALDLYKLDSGVTTQMPNRQASANESRNSQGSAADLVSTPGNKSGNVGDSHKRTWTRAEINRMSGDEFAILEDELTLAMHEGRVQ